MITRNNIQPMFSDISLSGPSSNFSSQQFLWLGGRGMISPRGTLSGAAQLRFAFQIEGDKNGSEQSDRSVTFKLIEADDTLDGFFVPFDFWLPRCLISAGINCDAEEDTCSGVGANLISLAQG